MRPMHRRRTSVALLALSVATVLALAAGCSGDGGGSGDGSRESPGQGAAINATSAPLLPTRVDALPEADASTLTALLEQLRGTPVLVNVWASWCGPCRAEAPALAAAAARYGDRVQFLGVDVLDARESAVAFIEEQGWTWPHLFDVTGDVMNDRGMLGPPVTLFFDAEGVLVATWPGEISADVLEARLAELVG